MKKSTFAVCAKNVIWYGTIFSLSFVATICVTMPWIPEILIEEGMTLIGWSISTT